MSDASKAEANKEALKLKQAAGEAPWTLLHCPNCHDKKPDRYTNDKTYSWSLKLHCDSCNHSWWVCKLCPKVKNWFTTPKHLHRHNTDYHKDLEQDMELDETDDLPKEDVPNEEHSISDEYIKRAATTAFFRSCQDNIGIETLVAKAVFQNTTVCNNLDPDDVITFMTTAHFIATLSRSQREDLAEVLDTVCETTKRQMRRSRKQAPTKLQKTSSLHIPPLTNKQIIRSTIIEGKHSLYANLPHPLVLEDTQHAYALPSDCLADFMGHGLLKYNPKNQASNHPVEGLGHCHYAQELKNSHSDKETTVIFASIWSDGFDPNYTLGNRGSAWIMTLCIQPEHVDHVDLHHMYPIAIGKEKDVHDDVLAVIINDLNSLKDVRMYDGTDKTNKKVALYVVAVTQDQPERRAFTATLAGNSTIHSRFGWLVDLSQVQDKLRPCVACEKDLVERNTGRFPECEDCFNWMAHPDQIKFNLSENMPDDYEDTLPMTRITYDQLKNAAETAHEKILDGSWTRKNADAYLNLNGINEKRRTQILMCAENCRVHARAIEENNNDVIQAIQAERERDPRKYAKWEPIPVWNSGLRIHQSTEAGMHLLFLGAVKTIVFAIKDWSRLRMKFSSLRRRLETLSVLLELLHLSWCKVMAYRGKKLGAWISENYMGWCRVLPWVYSCLEDLADDPKFVPPDKPKDKWTAKENSAFLRARGVTPKGDAAALRKLVVEHQNTPLAEPSGGPLKEVKSMILAMWVMMCTLMGMTESKNENGDICDRVIRLFLTRVYDHHNSSRSSTKTPLWMASYNFVCLLNIPEQVKNLGPMRNRWEGGVRGEKFLRQVKPVLGSTRRKNWQKNLLTNLLRQRELLILKRHQRDTQKAAGTEELAEEEEDINDTTAVHVYSSAAEIGTTITDNDPVSCVIVEDPEGRPQVHICFRFDRDVWTLPARNVGNPTYWWGLWYHEYDVREAILKAEDENDTSLTLLCDLQVASYGLMLPKLSEKNKPMYAIVDSMWRAMDGEGMMSSPRSFIQRDANGCEV